MYANRFAQGRKKIVDKQRQTRNVVEMSMGQDNVPDIATLNVRARKSQTPGNYGDAVVDDDRHEMLTGRCPSAFVDSAWQQLDFHLRTKM
jgi:hypothetical protein